MVFFVFFVCLTCRNVINSASPVHPLLNGSCFFLSLFLSLSPHPDCNLTAGEAPQCISPATKVMNCRAQRASAVSGWQTAMWAGVTTGPSAGVRTGGGPCVHHLWSWPSLDLHLYFHTPACWYPCGRFPLSLSPSPVPPLCYWIVFHRYGVTDLTLTLWLAFFFFQLSSHAGAALPITHISLTFDHFCDWQISCSGPPPPTVRHTSSVLHSRFSASVTWII